MGLMDWISRLLYDDQVKQARSRRGGTSSAATASLSRLNVILAHDRTGLSEVTMAKIREEIQQVIAKYVYIDTENVVFNLETDDQLTLVTATFPLSGARPKVLAEDEAIAASVSGRGVRMPICA